MLRYILKRVVSMFVTLWVVITVTFFLMHSIPGDPFTNEKKIPEEIMANLKHKYGLDQPLIVQYGKYLQNLTKLDLGISLKYKNRSVNDMISEGFPESAKLGMSASLFGITMGILLGIIASLNHKGFWDYFVIFIAIVGVSVPNFVFSSLFQYVFGVQLGWLPVARWGTPVHVILPAAALGFRMIAFQARMMRTSMLDVLGQDYIKTAKSKGLTKARVTRRHAIRNAILPVITILGPLLAAMLTGTFVVEKIFAIPGLGKFYIQSIQQNDFTVILGTTVFYSSVLVLMIFFVDVAYGLIDPRIRLDEGQ
ncbi:MAG: ABC transporter permease [Tissierellales bacterium]|nr:ABC transporter permease [Tissierellales bacterium]